MKEYVEMMYHNYTFTGRRYQCIYFYGRHLPEQECRVGCSVIMHSSHNDWHKRRTVKDSRAKGKLYTLALVTRDKKVNIIRYHHNKY